MAKTLWNDEIGAIVSIEMILIITIVILGLIVGWSEVAHAVNTELDDISNAIGKLNQSYMFSGFHSFKSTRFNLGCNTFFFGSGYIDRTDDCDGNCSGISDITCCAAIGEQGASGSGFLGTTSTPVDGTTTSRAVCDTTVCDTTVLHTTVCDTTVSGPVLFQAPTSSGPVLHQGPTPGSQIGQ